jgi:tetrapyrrole methylase family protein/MazG family protein
VKNSVGKKFENLVRIVEKLRAPKGCPWDRVQTHKTLKPYMVEEVYEALDAIDSGDSRKLREELGDMLLHIVMHANMASEKKKFSVADVIDSISTKMIGRHPHVFGSKKAKSIAEVWQRWEEQKQKEIAEKGEKHKSILESIPQALPALYRADKVQRRAARVGFDWDSVAGAWEKVHEEEEEIRAVLRSSKRQGPSTKKLKEEIGDLLFAVVNVARKLDIDSEEALQTAVSKFARRFNGIEEHAKNKGVKLANLSLNEMDMVWDRIKSKEKK